MKVLAIVASARKTGNSEILAKEMLAALPATAEKKLLNLSELVIEPCKACYACLGQGDRCVIADDFDIFLQQVLEADAVIIAAPVYFLGMHTRLKLLCDRLISVLNEAEKYVGRRCVIAVPFGVEGWQGYGVEATVSFARFLHLEVVGVLPVNAANPGEVVKPEILAAARELSLQLLEGAPVSDQTGAGKNFRQTVDADGIVCDSCGGGLFRLSRSGTVACVVCGTEGAIDDQEKSGQSLAVKWPRPEHYRYSVDGMAEHAQRLEAIKADFLARRKELAELRKPYKDGVN